jgi:tight adherence protein C
MHIDLGQASAVAAGAALFLFSCQTLRWAMSIRIRRWRFRGSVRQAIWRVFQACLPVTRSVLPEAARQRLARLLRRAGMDTNRWLPEYIVTLQWQLFVATAPVFAGIAHFGLQAGPVAAPAVVLAASGAAAWLPLRQLQGRAGKRQSRILRDLPFMLDMITLCVEAGQNLHGALQQVAQHGPQGPLREELLRVLADMRAGVPRARAMEGLAHRTGVAALASLAVLIVQAEKMGMSLGPLLRIKADQCRAEHFLRAEKLALQAPVKMLFPLVACLFPCTFLVIAFPIGYRLLNAGF